MHANPSSWHGKVLVALRVVIGGVGARAVWELVAPMPPILGGVAGIVAGRRP